jgi:hypothetical protein
MVQQMKASVRNFNNNPSTVNSANLNLNQANINPLNNPSTFQQQQDKTQEPELVRYKAQSVTTSADVFC